MSEVLSMNVVSSDSLTLQDRISMLNEDQTCVDTLKLTSFISNLMKSECSCDIKPIDVCSG